MNKEIELKQTCGACPEQYDAYLGDEKVGYLRLRHGYFSVEVPYGGEIIYSANTKGDGLFEEEERAFHLEMAKKAIKMKLLEDSLREIYE